MKLRDHSYIALCVFAILAALSPSFEAAAQPYLAPNTPLVGYGPPPPRSRFYIEAGIRFRDMDSVQFRQEAPTINYQNPGVPAFGPNVAGAFGTGTGVTGFPQTPTYNPADDPNASGVWIYDNGFVDARSPGYPGYTTEPGLTGGVAVQRPPDTVYPAPSDPPNPIDASTGLARDVQLGRFHFIVSQCAAATGDAVAPGTGWPCRSTGYNVGSFQMNDTFGQVDNPKLDFASEATDAGYTMRDTTRLSWSRLIDGDYNARTAAGSNEVASQLFSGAGSSFHRKFENKLFGPTVEIGFQSSSFFSVFMGMSLFTLDNNISRSAIVDVPFGRRGYTDTFSFWTDFPNADPWPSTFSSVTRNPDPTYQWNTQGTVFGIAGASGSNCACLTSLKGTENDDGSISVTRTNACGSCEGADEQNFRIWPDGPGQGVFPTRQFFENFGAAARDNVQEDVTHGIDMEIYEGRMGGKSWFPLFGMGRIGVAVGGTFSPIRYRIRSTRLLTSLGPNAPGTVIDFRRDQAYGWWWNFGGFLSGDLEFQVGNFITKASAEYVLCTSHDAKVVEVQTSVNPGGMGATLSAGIAF